MNYKASEGIFLRVKGKKNMVVFCQIARALKMVKQNCIQCWYQLTAVL